MNERVAAFTARFSEIGAEHMADLPVYNPVLQVEAVGFQPWGPGWIGVLITPWFMNVMLLPREPQLWKFLVVGHKVTRKLSGGEQEFVVGEDDELGKYQFRSLHSPMFRFKSQESARKTAAHALERLMNPPQVEVPLSRPQPANRDSERRAVGKV